MPGELHIEVSIKVTVRNMDELFRKVAAYKELFDVEPELGLESPVWDRECGCLVETNFNLGPVANWPSYWSIAACRPLEVYMQRGG